MALAAEYIFLFFRQPFLGFFFKDCGVVFFSRLIRRYAKEKGLIWGGGAYVRTAVETPAWRIER